MIIRELIEILNQLDTDDTRTILIKIDNDDETETEIDFTIVTDYGNVIIKPDLFLTELL